MLLKNKMGFLTGLWNKAKTFVSDTYNKGRSWLTGGSNYIGPFNRLDREYLEQHPPTDAVDAGALHHDKDYSNIAKNRDNGTISQQEAKNMIRDSDNRFLHNTYTNMHTNPLGGALGWAGIKLKTKLEDWGILDPNQFVTAKRGGLMTPLAIKFASLR